MKYYTLIARAVSALSDNTAEARQNLYERARVALTSSLLRHDPPMSEADFERERSAFEASIMRVEREASIGQTQTADAVKTELIQSYPADETTRSTERANILPAALTLRTEDQAHATVSALEPGIKRVEQQPSIGQTQTADAVKTELIQSYPADEMTGSPRPANISPAALPPIREDQPHPTVSALEPGIMRVEQEPSIGQTQTADAVKIEPIQSRPAEETTRSTGPVNISPAALPQIREDQPHPTVSVLEPGIMRVEQEPSIGQTPAQAHPVSQRTNAANEPANTLPTMLSSIRDPKLPRITPIRKTFVYVDRLLLGVTCVISIAFAIAVFLRPGWLTHIFDYLLFAACSAVILCTLGMLPVAQAKVSKVGLLCTFLVSSYLLGMTTWVLGMLITLQYWGAIGLIIGLCLGIVGVVPLGIVAATINADWSMVAMMIVGVLITYGARDLASGAINAPPLAQPVQQSLND